ncbi:uncharacterized protein isoform X3 [Takifugu rubripes]|uniref:uncharacterized protein isoform X3 n=1 Tax=Takifugu rubripes TaxID=31033 RepID=UPI001145D783|nr:uncharacterized protein LOC105419133 isoform X3 [Takifugu rubripes]
MLKQNDVIFIKGEQNDLKQIQETGLLLFFDDIGQNLHLSAPTIAHFLWNSSGSDTQMRRFGGNAATVQRSTMKSLLLLLLSLLTGSDSAVVRGFKGGWLEFTSWYPDLKHNYTLIKVNEAALKSFNQWETFSNLRLYHDTERKEVKVGIKGPSWSSRRYKIKFYPEKPSKRDDDHDDDDDGDERTVDVKLGSHLTQTQTVRRAAGATVRCVYPNQNPRHSLFFCKENNDTCEEILGTQSPRKTNGSFTLEKTSRGFNIFISRVSSRDNGVYWCAEKGVAVRAAFQKISIQVEDEESSTAARTRPTSASTVRPVEKDPATKGDSWLPVLMALTCGALLLMLLLLYRWLKKSRNKEESTPEEAAYEEIQERPHTHDPTTAMKTIYVTAGFPTNPPAAFNKSQEGARQGAAHGATHKATHGAPHGAAHGAADALP